MYLCTFILRKSLKHWYRNNIKDQEKADGVTSTGKPVVDVTGNDDGEKCEKCDKIGDSLLICSVKILFYNALVFDLLTCTFRAAIGLYIAAKGAS